MRDKRNINGTINWWAEFTTLLKTAANAGDHFQDIVYTGCHRRNGQNFGRVFLMLNYTDITQNTYVPS